MYLEGGLLEVYECCSCVNDVQESSRAAPTAAVSAEEDLNAFFQSKDSRQDSGAAFLQHYLQQRLWAQDGDDAGAWLESLGRVLCERSSCMPRCHLMM